MLMVIDWRGSIEWPSIPLLIETRRTFVEESRIQSRRISLSNWAKYETNDRAQAISSDRSLICLDKIIGTTALTKYYCQYRKDIGLMRMINFTQTSTKPVSFFARKEIDVWRARAIVKVHDRKIDERNPNFNLFFWSRVKITITDEGSRWDANELIWIDRANPTESMIESIKSPDSCWIW